MRCGVVLFDSAGDTTALASLDSGWASVGGENAERVSSIHDLPSDVLWIVNLNETQFYRAGLLNHPNFRSDGYLRSSLQHIYDELGIDPKFVSPAIVATALATIAQRLLHMAETRYNLRPRSRKALNDDFATALGAPRSQVAPDMYSMFEGAAQHAYVTTVSTNTYAVGGRTLTLRRNRLMHARDLLGRALPQDTQWEHIPKAKLPQRNADIESFLEASKTPFLVRCEVSRVNPLIGDVFSVGGGSRAIRDWLTDIEWREARSWADIAYHGVVRCTLPAVQLPQAQALPAGAFDPLSFTCGLAAEQIWTAMTLKRGFRDDMRYTAAAAWLRATDRMIMFQYAQKLYGKGLTVFGYGSGNVVVRYPENGLRHALDVTTDIGLLPPAGKLLEAGREAQAAQAARGALAGAGAGHVVA